MCRHVPFDNDMWFRYNSVAVAEMKSAQPVTSNEVTAIYSNTSRQAIVLGSRHARPHWKHSYPTRTLKQAKLSGLDVYGGISSPTGIRTDTHDTIPHGIVSGARVLSPRIFIGSYSDWRDGLEAYGAANAAIHPPLWWSCRSPMGWNSWARLWR